MPLAENGNFDMVWDKYQDWGLNLATQLGSLTGYIVKVEWLPDFEELNNVESINLKDSEIPRYTQEKR